MGVTWSKQDLAEFRERGWQESDAANQLEQLMRGCAAAKVIDTCSLGWGIVALNVEERNRALDEAQLARRQRCARFIPASGAASRMFSMLQGDLSGTLLDQLNRDILKFPFWSEKDHQDLSAMPLDERGKEGARRMLDSVNGWSHLPKGMIPFHRYLDGQKRNSFEEHILEWSLWMDGAPVHFTVPADFEEAIRTNFDHSNHITTSIQFGYTDTLALDLNANEVVREESGKLLFRPGGHGALLENLNQVAQSADYVFIRNIDNVVPKGKMKARNEEQAVLLGICRMRTTERNLLIAKAEAKAEGWRKECLVWLEQFDQSIGDDASDDEILRRLDCPIRVAGMVKNEGKPGGGPFWVERSDGAIVPAIVESAELPGEFLGKGSHFNPVDLVCSTQNAAGNPYDLNQFSDTSSYFTATKDWNGKKIRILERPGLWNGGMANWLTQFIEMPPSTFAPVKTVLDLLDPQRRKDCK